MQEFTSIIRSEPIDFDPFIGPEVVCVVPSTGSQREVWTASRMGRDASCAYIESVTLELEGMLDRVALDKAVAWAVLRHEAMRGVLSPDGMRMIILRELDVPFHHTDLSDLDQAERDNTMARIARQEVTLPFDLVNGPLFRFHLVRLGEDRHHLLISAHHVMCDGWSLGVLMADLSRCYNARLAGRDPDASSAERISDHALAQAGLIQDPGYAAVERFWLEQFKGSVPELELPTDRPRNVVRTFNGARIDKALDADRLKALKALSTRCGTSLVTTLLTAFELLLYKITGDSDMCIGLPAAGQSHFGKQDLVGHCVNLLALRSHIDEENSFLTHIGRRRAEVLDALEVQNYTLGTLLHRLNVKRNPGRIPLVPVVFNIDMNIDDGVDLAGLSHRFISNPRRYEIFESYLNITGGRNGATLEWSYNTDLFDAKTIGTWMDAFLDLIDRIVLSPETPIMDLVSDAPLHSERAMPPIEWHGTAVPYGSRKSVSMVFKEIVERYPDRIAVVQDDREMSYSRLDAMASTLAHRLRSEGLLPGDLVGICSARHMGMVVAQLAVLRSGATFVPIDPHYPMERKRFMLDDTGSKLLLVDAAYTSDLPPTRAKVLELQPDGGPISDRPSFTSEDSADGAAYIMYTSGSTGTPKGVVVPHRAIVRLVREQNYAPLGPDTVIAQLSNPSFDASTFEIWGALLNGGRLVLPVQRKPTLREIVDLVDKKDVNVLFLTTGMFNVLVDEHLGRLGGVKCILTGGEVMSAAHARKAIRSLGPGVLRNIYGPTENTTFSCSHAIDTEADIVPRIPIGQAIHNTFLYVLDPAMQPLPVGVRGELFCGGDGVALGYWQRPDLTAERFLPDPFRGGNARMYRTGDLVKWTPEGTLEFHGRMDAQVKVRGHRIEPGEIENLLEQLPGVRDSVVVVRGDQRSEKQLVAYVVPENVDLVNVNERDEIFLERIRGVIQERLPSYMVPSHFVALHAIPLNANGKVDEHALPAPEHHGSPLHVRHLAPRNAMERALISIWCDVLGISDIGVKDNFFDLGGHSLIGIKLLDRVEQEFQRTLPLHTLYEAPTVERLAAMLKGNAPRKDWTNLSLVQPRGELDPLFCVHGDEANHFIPRYLGNDRPFYGFFHQGEDGRRMRYTTVPDIAKHFVEELRDARPHGPYLLCGYSFGGVVAFEMAQQLRRTGVEVPFLLLIDTYSPKLHDQAMRMDVKFHGPLKDRVYRKLIAWYFSRGKVLPPRLRHFHIIDTYDQAVRAYEPEPYDGKLTMLKAIRSWGPKDMGWSSLSTQILDIHTIPGDHSTAIEEPNVKELVRILATCIAEVERTRAATG